MADPTQRHHEEAPIFDHDVDMPYAGRSIKAVFWLIFFVFVIGGFVAWYFLDPSQNEQSTTENNIYSARINAEVKSDNTALHRIFEEMFSGIGDGLDASVVNIDSDPGLNTAIQTQLYIRKRAEALSAAETGYRHSLFNVIGAQVEGRADQKAGTVFDILVDRETGEAQALIIDEDGLEQTEDLKDIKFQKVFIQTPDGHTKLNIPEQQVEQKDPFRYAQNNSDQTISLRRLRAGQVLDFEGNVAGQIDAVIYGNAEAQRLVIDLRPVLARAGAPASFYISFDQARFEENPDGLDIKLTETQTRALAKELFKNSQNN